MKPKTPPTAPPIPEPLTGTAKTGAAIAYAQSQVSDAAARRDAADADAYAGSPNSAAWRDADSDLRMFGLMLEGAQATHATETAAEKRCEDEAWARAQLPSLLGHDVAVADAMDAMARAIDVLKSTISRRDSTIQMVAQGCHGRDTDRVIVDAVGPRIEGYGGIRLNHDQYANYAARLFAGVVRLGSSPQIAATLASMGNQVPPPHRPDPSTEVLVGGAA